MTTLTLLIFAAGLLVGWQWHRHKQQTERKFMSALENLTAAITRLQASVDAAVTDINTPHPTEAQVQVAADAVNAQSERLELAVNPPPAA